MPGVLERGVLDCQGARFVGCQFSVAFLALGEPLGLFKSLLGTLSALRATVPFRKAAREKIIINIHKQSLRNFIIQKAVDNMI